jgi:hypothetical protein
VRRWVPALAAALGLAWFGMVTPRLLAAGDAHWHGSHGPNLNDAAIAVVLAAKDRSVSWPSAASTVPFAALLDEAEASRKAAEDCAAVIDAVLDEAQRTALPALGAAMGEARGSVLTDPELHQALAHIMAVQGTPIGAGAPVPARVRLTGLDLRTRNRGLDALALGAGPGLRRDQALALLPVCLDAELVSGRTRLIDAAMRKEMPPVFAPWFTTHTDIPVPVPGAYASLLQLASALLREGPGLLDTVGAAPLPPAAPPRPGAPPPPLR